MRDLNRQKVMNYAAGAAGIIITAALAVFLFQWKKLFFQPSPLTSVKAEVPFENSRTEVFRFLIGILVLMAADAAVWTVMKVKGKKLKIPFLPDLAIGIIRKLAILAAACLNAVWSFYLIEFINNYYLADMKRPYLLLGIGITAVLECIFIGIFNSFSAGLIASNWFFFVWGAVNYFVQQFRGIPFQWVDFSSIGTAASVAGNYKYTPNWQICAGLVLTCALTILWLRIGSWHISRKMLAKLLSRATAVVLAVSFGVVIFRTDYLADTGIWLRDWQPWYTYRLFGMEAGFLAFAKASFPQAPDVYSDQHVAEIIKTSQEEDSRAAGADIIPENIICIMNESFTDLTIYPNFKADKELTSNVMSLRDNTQSGRLFVSVKGGTTANTEYEFLTGNSCVLSPATVVYNSFIKQDQYSIAKTLEAQGYRALAMHPYGQYGWNRNTVYPKMGFEEFLHRDNHYQDAEKIRGLVSDSADYRALIEQVEQKQEGEKLFIFNITMQNHSSYKSDKLKSTVKVENFNGKNLGQAEQYCTLLKISDEAVMELLEYFEKSEQKTMILFWGDHQPEIGDDFWEYCYGKSLVDLNFEEQQLQFQTPWFLWANYDIPEKQNVDMSVNYLGSYLLEAAGLQMTGYEQYLSSMREMIPAMNAYGYVGQDGVMHQWDTEDAGETESAKLNDYLCLIYNELTGGAKRDRTFFALEADQ